MKRLSMDRFHGALIYDIQEFKLMTFKAFGEIISEETI